VLECSSIRSDAAAVLAPLLKTPPAGIALFDLDGTLIAWDCQLLFRHFVLRREPWRGVFLPIFLVFLPLLKLLGAGGMKRIFLCYLWKMAPADLAKYSAEFAAAVMPAIFPEIREKLETHRRAGHLLILASASPEIYVTEIGKALGFDLSYGTPVTFGDFFPDLVNHKGAAKVRRLLRELPASYFENGKLVSSHGYTDSAADLPMLALCQAVTLVNPAPVLSAIGSSAGWKISHPARPWSSKIDFIQRALALLLGLGDDPGGVYKATPKKSNITAR
jgi:HAD superfamily phosphoserine phosphatase-like hydrolase